MPFDTLQELPDKVKSKIPSKKGKKIFMSAFNNAYDTTGGNESVSFATAWSALKQAGFAPDEDGEYHKPESRQIDNDVDKSPGLSSVHAGGVLEEESVTFVKEDFELPETARDNARKVLRWKEEHPDEIKGMTETGWRRARQLAENKTVGEETVEAMAQFNRHRKNSKIDPEHEGEPWKDAGYVAWLGWGGDTGIDWAIRESEKINKGAFTFDCQFTKLNIEQRLVYGWASIIEENGQPLVDGQGDVITPAELVKAAHRYVTDSRAAKVMHEGGKMGEMVESVVFTRQVQDALGIDLNKTGWFVGFKIYDDEVWQRVKEGELAMFSIGGRGKRERLS